MAAHSDAAAAVQSNQHLWWLTDLLMAMHSEVTNFTVELSAVVRPLCWHSRALTQQTPPLLSTHKVEPGCLLIKNLNNMFCLHWSLHSNLMIILMVKLMMPMPMCVRHVSWIMLSSPAESRLYLSAPDSVTLEGYSGANITITSR